MKNLYYLLTLIIIIACNKVEPTITSPEPNLSKIIIENRQFKKADGTVFFPWGFNYTNPEGVGLIEDNWLNEEVWQVIKSDFTEMKALGANVVRIHLQYHQFMIDATTPNTSTLNRLKELVELAEQEKLYLDITGLAAYIKNAQPTYYTSMTDEERWATQKIFWESIAEQVGDSPAVFAYNLMNEPVVSVGCNTVADCEWTPGNGFGGFHFVQNITTTAGLEYTTTFKSWIAQMSQAIRSKDRESLITVGVLSLGPYSQFATDLDYLSPHIYPKSGEIQNAIDQILANQSNVPVVIEETSNLHCNIKELEEFITGIDGKYNGLLGHYFGTPIDELDESKINQAIQKNFLQFFIKNNPN